MSFGDAFAFYYKTVLDLTTYIAYSLIAFGFCILLIQKPFEKRQLPKLLVAFIITYAVCILFSSLMFAVSNLIPNRAVLQIVYALSLPIIVITFSLVFSKGRKLHRVIKTLVLVSSISVVEGLSKNIGFFIGTVSNNLYFAVALARALPYFFFPVVCNLLKFVDINHYRNLSKGMVTIISVLSSVLIAVSLYEQASMSQDKAMVVLLSVLDSILLFLLNFAYYMTYKSIENRHRITNLEVQKTLENAERMSIAIDKTNREELEKVRHDIKNQFSYLGVMLQQGKIDESKQYIEDYLNTSNPVLNSFSCSNNVINSIINLELTKAKIQNIKIDVKVVVPPSLPFQDIDLVSLLTNMIDNAIENYYDENKKPITVRIMKQNDFIRFLVANPVNMKNINPRSLTTTKKTGRGHGYGTKIIKNIASAYNGYVDFSVQDNSFICDAVLNLNIKE